MKLNLGGIVPVSTVDWHGRSAIVIFFNGCPFRCVYCQNYRLLNATNLVEPGEVEKKIIEARIFVNASVFSGGEPLMQFEALEKLAGFAKKQGLKVGIQTNGYYPEKLEKLIGKKLVDKIFLDIKAPLYDAKGYSMITGIEDAAERVFMSLSLKGMDMEARTTVFRSLNDVTGIAESLEGFDCTYVIQQGIPENAPYEEIRKQKPLTRDELISIAKTVSFLKDVRIRTKEKGEERVKPRI